MDYVNRSFTLYRECIGDIVKLVRYSYENTAEISESEDELRSLVVHYVACIIEDLVQDSEFQLFLEDLGPFSKDLVKQMRSDDWIRLVR
jgi:hypothetical protein